MSDDLGWNRFRVWQALLSWSYDNPHVSRRKPRVGVVVWLKLALDKSKQYRISAGVYSWKSVVVNICLRCNNSKITATSHSSDQRKIKGVFRHFRRGILGQNQVFIVGQDRARVS